MPGPFCLVLYWIAPVAQLVSSKAHDMIKSYFQSITKKDISLGIAISFFGGMLFCFLSLYFFEELIAYPHFLGVPIFPLIYLKNNLLSPIELFQRGGFLSLGLFFGLQMLACVFYWGTFWVIVVPLMRKRRFSAILALISLFSMFSYLAGQFVSSFQFWQLTGFTVV